MEDLDLKIHKYIEWFWKEFWKEYDQRYKKNNLI